MPLYRKEIYKNGSHFTEWRYFCDCDCPDHVLTFSEWGEPNSTELFMSIVNSDNLSLWERVKNAFKLLLNMECCYKDVVISPKDRVELGKAISGMKDD